MKTKLQGLIQRTRERLPQERDNPSGQYYWSQGIIHPRILRAFLNDGEAILQIAKSDLESPMTINDPIFIALQTVISHWPSFT